MCRGQEMVYVPIEFVVANCKEMYLARIVGYVIVCEWWSPVLWMFYLAYLV